MVWAALGTLAGGGLQSYGADQKTQAMKRAEDAYQQWLRRFNGTEDRDQAQMQQFLGDAGNKYAQSQQDLVSSFDPVSRLNSFEGGQAQSRAGIEQVLSLMGSQQPHQILPTGGENVAFNQAVSREQGANQAAAGRLTGVVAQGAGLEAMRGRDAENVFGFSDNASVLSNKIQRAQQLYGLGQALRNKALTRASGQHRLDMSAAQTAGNGAMFAGGLVSAGAQAYGSYQANQPRPQTGGGLTNTSVYGVGGAGAADYAQPAVAFDPNLFYRAQA